ncbi:putative nuclease HARBI1, partial [Anopheles gambiae]|uniref:putative nuclease HARBI1 n=1 Tax=Anopheles gambiae TaxID=7165 RepID=UPI002AC99ACA
YCFSFIQNFRVSKAIFLYLFDGLHAQLNSQRCYGLDTKEQIAACLIFFATGSYQRGVGKDFHIAIAQKTFSKVLQQTLVPLHNLIRDWIKLAMSEEERQEAKDFFFEKSGFENIVMCVDGTHIKIKKPRNRPLQYLNRKNVYSINALIVCDHKYRIRAIDARFAGSNHDAHIWRVSPVRAYFEHLHRSGQNERLFGDAGYPSEPWIVRPHRDPDEGSVEAQENSKISSGRMTVEQSIGILKSRFRS